LNPGLRCSNVNSWRQGRIGRGFAERDVPTGMALLPSAACSTLALPFWARHCRID
jgi:hypothetical protein